MTDPNTDSLVHYPHDAETRQAAALTVAMNAHDSDDAKVILQALGLTSYDYGRESRRLCTNDADQRDMLARWRNGESMEEIGRLYGIKRQTVHGHIRKLATVQERERLSGRARLGRRPS